jgi:geranylgeranylglycerol-phosphate geranylgeranyltransferase
MIGFAVIVGAVLSESGDLSALTPRNLMFGFITGFALTAGSMVVNDFYDREIDAINEPGRPIPSGLIKPSEALVYALALAIIGFAAAAETSTYSLAIGALSWVIFTTYTTVGKRSGLPGNFLVSTCVVMPFLYGSVVATNSVNLNVLIFGSMVFLSNTGREITKGIVDIEGDRRLGIKTLAVRFGDWISAIIAALFYLAAVILSPVPILLGLVSVWFIPPVAVTDIGLALSSIALLKDHSRESARMIKRVVLVCFLFGLVAFLIGGVK